MRRVLPLTLLALAGFTCARPPAVSTEPHEPVAISPAPPASEPATSPVPARAPSSGFAAELGKQVVVEGTAANAKLGALLETDRGVLWIDGLHAWPEGFYEGQGTGRRLRVTGVLIERQDLPVFVEKPGEPVMQGIPVPPGTDLSKASRRYLLRQATWVALP